MLLFVKICARDLQLSLLGSIDDIHPCHIVLALINCHSLVLTHYLICVLISHDGLGVWIGIYWLVNLLSRVIIALDGVFAFIRDTHRGFQIVLVLVLVLNNFLIIQILYIRFIKYILVKINLWVRIYFVWVSISLLLHSSTRTFKTDGAFLHS